MSLIVLPVIAKEGKGKVALSIYMRALYRPLIANKMKRFSLVCHTGEKWQNSSPVAAKEG